MPVTASVLYNLVQCPQRVALDALGDTANRDEVNPFVRLLWERGTHASRGVPAGQACNRTRRQSCGACRHLSLVAVYRVSLTGKRQET